MSHAPPSTSPVHKGPQVETPSIWEDYKFLGRSTKDPEGFREMTVASLRRSQGGSLDLDLDYRYLSADGDELAGPPQNVCNSQYGSEDLNIISTILIPFAPQIRLLKWTVPTKALIQAFLSIPAGTFSRLESVEITFLNQLPQSLHNSYLTGDARDSFTVFHGLSKLRRVTMRLLNGISALSLGLPLRNITILNLSAVSIPQDVFMELIYHGAPSLVVGFFHIQFTRLHNNGGLEYIYQACGRNIKNLHLKFTEPGEVEPMFELLTLPALEELKIDHCDANNGWKFLNLATMLEASASTLKVLSLWSFLPPPPAPRLETPQLKSDVHQAALEQLCENFKCLIALHLPSGVVFPPNALKEFATGNFLPRLEVLKLSSPDGSSILRAVQRRNEAALAYLSYPGSSTLQTPIRFLSLLVLAVLRENKSAVEAECNYLKDNTALGATDIIIWDGNM